MLGREKRKAEKFPFYPAVHCCRGGTRENELILSLGGSWSASVRPSVQEFWSLILRSDLKSLFRLLSFPFSFKKLYIPVKRSTDGERETGRGGEAREGEKGRGERGGEGG